MGCQKSSNNINSFYSQKSQSLDRIEHKGLLQSFTRFQNVPKYSYLALLSSKGQNFEIIY